MNSANPYAALLRRRHGVGAEPGPRDHAERAFRPHEELGQVGAHRGARRAAGVDRAAVGEHDVEAGDDVFDLPVPSGQLARSAAREPPTDRRQRDRLRPVPAGEVVLRAQRVFEHVAEGAGAHVDDQRRAIDFDDTGEPAEVEHDAAVYRDARAADSTASGGDRDRNLRFRTHA